MEFEFTASYSWLIAGAVMLAIEAFGVPGIGFLFAGLAAIFVGLFAQYGLVGSDNYVAQFAWFFGITAALAALLWKKLKSWHTNPDKASEYNNIVGDAAIVGKGGLTRGKAGQVSWSGTTMMAEISADAAVSHIEEDAAVLIREVRGNKLIVAPQSSSE